MRESQRPFAVILGCSDSRVPPELVFDQGFGDLFVIRLAGNVIEPSVFGSIQYAHLHLGTSLLVVLGHEGCGAVKAALAAKFKKAKHPERIQRVVDLIDPALTGVQAVAPVLGNYRRPPKPTSAGRSIRCTAIPKPQNAFLEKRDVLIVGARL